MSAASSTRSPQLFVYDGQTFLGTVERTSGGNWTAHDPDGRRVGVFTDQATARRALADAQRAPS